MARGNFIWTDLSTLRLGCAKAFYADLFGWTYQRLLQPDGSHYAVASTSFGEAAGVFEMPKKFQEMGLPCFWMPYFAVEECDAACARALECGGRVELRADWSDKERVALIRDPLGAGFTVYQGEEFAGVSFEPRHGHLTGTTLYISDISAVRAFYEALFGWQMEETQQGELTVHNRQGSRIVSIRERDEGWRGGHHFWGIYFTVANAGKAIEKIETAGGEILEQSRISGALTILAKDPDCAAFFLRQLSE